LELAVLFIRIRHLRAVWGCLLNFLDNFAPRGVKTLRPRWVRAIIGRLDSKKGPEGISMENEEKLKKAIKSIEKMEKTIEQSRYPHQMAKASRWMKISVLFFFLGGVASCNLAWGWPPFAHAGWVLALGAAGCVFSFIRANLIVRYAPEKAIYITVLREAIEKKKKAILVAKEAWAIEAAMREVGGADSEAAAPRKGRRL